MQIWCLCLNPEFKLSNLAADLHVNGKNCKKKPENL